jgi:hypothetical protein
MFTTPVGALDGSAAMAAADTERRTRVSARMWRDFRIGS